MNRAEISRLIKLLQSEYPNHPIPDVEMLIQSWELQIGAAPFEAGVNAVMRWIASGERFFPTSGHIRQLLGGEIGGVPDGPEGWVMVLDRMKATYPGHPAPPWDVPECVKQAVKAMGGMDVLRHSENPGMDRTQFLKIYETYRNRAVASLDLGALGDGRAVVEALPNGRDDS